MGGELQVESALGEGSRFYFTLPLVLGRTPRARAPDVDAAAPPLDARLAPGGTLTALVADDSTVNRRILAELLESAGVQVITAAGGGEAVELAREHRPDVIFMDLRMADLDGFEATRRLRADPVTGAHSGDRGDRQRLRRHARGRARRRLRGLPAEAGARRSRCSRRCAAHLGVRFVARRRAAGRAGGTSRTSPTRRGDCAIARAAARGGRASAPSPTSRRWRRS